MKSLSFESIGTMWRIDVFDNISEAQLESNRQKIQDFLKDFTRTYSRFDNDSLVTKISKKKGSYSFPRSSKEIFSIYKKLYKLTNGKFTPLVGETLSSLGYDSKYSFKEKTYVETPKWEDVIHFRYPNLSVKKPVILDFGAGGKGYAIDVISDILRNQKIESFIIDAGGDIKIFRFEAIVGLEHPLDTKKVLGVVNLNNKSICASAQNRRTWGKHSHIINPQNMSGKTKVIASWVISEKAFTADVIATCLFFEKPQILKKKFKFEYFILYSDMKIDKSKDFKAKIYYN